MSYLKWVSDESLITAVDRLFTITKEALDSQEDKFYKNVIDPFSAMFQIAGFGIDFNNWIISEKSRQAQKSMQNHVGYFHQSILGAVDGWEDLNVGQGIDLVCHSKKIIAEVKNKHNTVTGGDLADKYHLLERLVTPKASQYKGYTAYFVNIIPKRPIRYDTYFEPSDKEKSMKCPRNPLIRTIDGASFYELVTGVEKSLEQLFSCLPDVIRDISNKTFTDSEKVGLMKLFEKAFQ